MVDRGINIGFKQITHDQCQVTRGPLELVCYSDDLLCTAGSQGEHDPFELQLKAKWGDCHPDAVGPFLALMTTPHAVRT